MSIQPIGNDRIREIERRQVTRSAPGVTDTDDVDRVFEDAVAQQVQQSATTPALDPTVALLNGNGTQAQLFNDQLANQLLAEQDQAAIELAGDISAQQTTSFAQALQSDRTVDTSQQMLVSQAMRSPGGMDLLAGSSPAPSVRNPIQSVDGLSAGQAMGAAGAGMSGEDEYASPDFATSDFTSTASDFAAAAQDFNAPSDFSSSNPGAQSQNRR